MRKGCFFAALLLCALLLILPERVSAEENVAQNITSRSLITEEEGFTYTTSLFDGYLADSKTVEPGSWLTIERDEGFGSLYIVFDLECRYTVTNNDTGESVHCGEYGFLHDFVDLEGMFGYAPKSVTLLFEDGATLVEFYFFTSGETPDFVQKWEPPVEGEADILLMPTHCDDDQLFLGGIVPLYEADRGYKVQVVYLTDHRNMTNQRCREALDALWAVGGRTYPVFGPFDDMISYELETAYSLFRQHGVTEEELVGFAVEEFRRFRPSVVIGHDVNGEYGHGQHRVYSDMIMKAAEISMDPEQYPETAEEYGTWEVPKVYLHLWPENRIYVDMDEPLDRFDGNSAYYMTKNYGFPCHRSQVQYYAWYMNGHDTAASILEYSPCEYGLYRTTVGIDEEKNDFMEHIGEDEPLPTEPEETEALTEPETVPTEPPATETILPETEAPTVPQETRPDTLLARVLTLDANSLYYALAAAAGILLLIACVAAPLTADTRKKRRRKK